MTSLGLSHDPQQDINLFIMRLFKSSDQVMEVVANSDARLDTETPPGFWPKVVSWVWDSDFYAKSPAERRLVFKMDCTILTIMCEYLKMSIADL